MKLQDFNQMLVETGVLEIEPELTAQIDENWINEMEELKQSLGEKT